MPATLKPNLNYQIGSWGHLHARLDEAKAVKDVDVLFLGSSHTYRGFDTRIFEKNGWSSFNLGSSSQTPIQTLALVKRYLNKLNPKVVVLEVYPVTLSLDGVEAGLDLVSNDRNDIYSVEMALKINHTKVYNTLTYAAIRDLLGLNDSFVQPLNLGSDMYVSGGYVEREVVYYSPKPLPTASIELKENQLAALKEIVQLVEEREIKMVLVYAPIPKSNYNRYSNNQEFDSTMKGISTYFNFNKLMHLNDSLHFQDEDHLNQLGVELFNAKLIEVLDNIHLETK